MNSTSIHIIRCGEKTRIAYVYDMRISMHVCAFFCTHLIICVLVLSGCAHQYTHTNIHTYTHTHIHTYTHTQPHIKTAIWGEATDISIPSYTTPPPTHPSGITLPSTRALKFEICSNRWSSKSRESVSFSFSFVWVLCALLVKRGYFIDVRTTHQTLMLSRSSTIHQAHLTRCVIKCLISVI